MANKPLLTSFLFPIVLPVVAFFIAYFLFPSFSREFFGVSVKGNSIDYIVSSDEYQKSRTQEMFNSEDKSITENKEEVKEVKLVPAVENEIKEPPTKTIKNPEFNSKGK